MKIAVLGASGATGNEVVRLALQAEHSVIAVVRTKSKITQEHENLQVVEANIYSEESLVPQFVGVDAVISCLGETGYRHLGPFGSVSFYSETIQPIIAAMRKAEVWRFVCITSWCVSAVQGDPGPFMMEWVIKPLILRGYLADMERMEQFLFSEENNDVNFTIVRPPELLKTPSKGQEILAEVRQFTEGGHMKMPREDLANFMLSVLSTDTYDRKGVAVDCA